MIRQDENHQEVQNGQKQKQPVKPVETKPGLTTKEKANLVLIAEKDRRMGGQKEEDDAGQRDDQKEGDQNDDRTEVVDQKEDGDQKAEDQNDVEGRQRTETRP